MSKYIATVEQLLAAVGKSSDQRKPLAQTRVEIAVPSFFLSGASAIYRVGAVERDPVRGVLRIVAQRFEDSLAPMDVSGAPDTPDIPEPVDDTGGNIA